MNISWNERERAQKLQKETPVADLHLDLPGELLFRHMAGENHIIRERYLPIWQLSGISLIGAAVYLEEEYLPDNGFSNALLQIEALLEEIESAREEVCLVCNRRDLEQAYRKEKIGILLYMEGLDFLKTEEVLLEHLYTLGVRGASLVWSRKNSLACGCCRASENRQVRGGITEMGRCVLRKMCSLGMFLDISHLNDDGMEEVLSERGAQTEILATHSNARAIHFHYRNLTDGQIEELVQRNGIIGINACSLISGSAEDGNHLEMLQKQGMYLLQKAGEERVCLGLDLCNNYDAAWTAMKRAKGKNVVLPKGHDALTGYGELELLTAAFLEAGASEKTVRGMLGENAFAFLHRVFTK